MSCYSWECFWATFGVQPLRYPGFPMENKTRTSEAKETYFCGKPICCGLTITRQMIPSQFYRCGQWGIEISSDCPGQLAGTGSWAVVPRRLQLRPSWNPQLPQCSSCWVCKMRPPQWDVWEIRDSLVRLHHPQKLMLFSLFCCFPISAASLCRWRRWQTQHPLSSPVTMQPVGGGALYSAFITPYADLTLRSGMMIQDIVENLQNSRIFSSTLPLSTSSHWWFAWVTWSTGTHWFL